MRNFVSRIVTLLLIGASTLVAQNGGSPAAAVLVNSVGAGRAFSFVYDGKPSADLLPHWEKSQTTKSLADGKKLRTITYRDPASGLEVSDELTSFPGVSAVERILRIRNSGAHDTPLIENILPLDLQFAATGTGKVVMHYARGSMGTIEDYLPIDQQVTSGTELELSHYVLDGDKHVNGQLPFFNLEWPGGGLIGAVGWSGEWSVRVRGEDNRNVSIQAGQQKTHLRLHPGEAIRTPRILLLQWQGNDRLVGHNQLRKLLLAYYVPRIDGKTVVPPVANSNAFVYEYQGIEKKTGQDPLEVVSHLKPGQENEITSLANDALNWVNEKNQLDFIRGIPPVGLELYWLDAGWFKGAWPFGVGTWDPDPEKFPHGLKPIGEAAHEKGLKFLLWFEPGRVGPGSAIAAQHPAWVLHRPDEGKLGGLFNFGNPAALQWMIKTLSQRITDWGLDIYRQDSNICPLPFWRTADAPDREGITEIRWVEGLYQLWDELLRQHPKLMIDNANWRITGPDIEVMKRSVGSLTRSETECGGIPHPTATQLQTEELSLWVPTSAGTVNGFDPYTIRSGATNGMGFGLDLQASYIPLEEAKDGIAEVKSLRPFWLGDYYPLTDIGLDEHSWAGWEFYRPDLKAGFAVLFRRASSEQPTFQARLRGMDPAAHYEVTFAHNYEVGEKRTMSGEQLMHLQAEIPNKAGSLLIRFSQAAH